MKILITGVSGLIGKAVSRHLQDKGNEIYEMSRSNEQSNFYWQEQAPHQWHIRWDDTIDIDAVIHLAGENIGSRRWSTAKKNRIRDSRIDTTDALIKKITSLDKPPSVLISASAIGYYGNGSKIVDERDPAGDDFLAQLSIDWENLANKAESAGVRVVNIRTGLVLASHGGALAKMLTPFRLGLGGRIGSGRQLMSWISIHEIPKIVDFLLNNQQARGAFNVVNPHVVSNADFTQSLATAVSRPALLPLPEFVVRSLFGEMGQLLLLNSIGVRPKKLEDSGYSFDDLSLDDALAKILSQ